MGRHGDSTWGPSTVGRPLLRAPEASGLDPGYRKQQAEPNLPTLAQNQLL